MEDSYIFIHNGEFISVFGDYTCVPDITENLGESWEDCLNGKYVMLNAEQMAYLNSSSANTPYEVFHMQENTEASLEDKERVIDNILMYDASNEVNVFYVNNSPVWFDKSTRVSLINSLNIEKELGKDTTILWISNTPYTMSIEEAKQLLTDLEVYAMACYNNTQNNIAKVRSLQLKTEVREFDITEGYPEKLQFNL